MSCCKGIGAARTGVERPETELAGEIPAARKVGLQLVGDDRLLMGQGGTRGKAKLSTVPARPPELEAAVVDVQHNSWSLGGRCALGVSNCCGKQVATLGS